MVQLRCTANEMSRYLSANATFLSIIATSPAVHGDLPQDFNGNNVQIGRTNKGMRIASVGDWKRFVDANYWNDLNKLGFGLCLSDSRRLSPDQIRELFLENSRPVL